MSHPYRKLYSVENKMKKRVVEEEKTANPLVAQQGDMKFVLRSTENEAQ